MASNFTSQYKGIYYKFVAAKSGMDCNVWILSDREDGTGVCLDFNADIDRLDQCLEDFKSIIEAKSCSKKPA